MQYKNNWIKLKMAQLTNKKQWKLESQVHSKKGAQRLVDIWGQEWVAPQKKLLGPSLRLFISCTLPPYKQQGGKTSLQLELILFTKLCQPEVQNKSVLFLISTWRKESFHSRKDSVTQMNHKNCCFDTLPDLWLLKCKFQVENAV